MRTFTCGRCGQTVYFDNHRCVACDSPLGYAPREYRMLALAADPARDAPLVGEVPGGIRWQACANRHTAAACNWLIAVDTMGAHAFAATRWDDALYAPPGMFCLSCRLTAVLPDLRVEGNAQRWLRIEQAKRQLMYTLIAMGLTPRPKRSPDDAGGLAFRLLADTPGEHVLTGHAFGVITLNVAEADDEQREAVRVRMHEPVRTLLGHLRHEIGHFLQFRWLSDDASNARCRAAFGDERADYAAALARYRADGPPPDWAQHFISAYASAHPWEDWAETCAHLLLIVDAVETSACWGLRLEGSPASVAPNADSLHASAWPEVDELILERWLPVARFVNAMNRSLGLNDAWPFLMPDAVLEKMRVARRLLSDAVATAARSGFGAPARV